MGKEQKSTGLLPVEEELIYRVGWLIKLRWLAATGLLISATVLNFFLNIPIAFLPLLTIGLVVIVYNILFKIYFQRSTKNLVRKTEPLDSSDFFDSLLWWDRESAHFLFCVSHSSFVDSLDSTKLLLAGRICHFSFNHARPSGILGYCSSCRNAFSFYWRIL